MKAPKLRELREAVTSLFSRPYTSRFPYEPHIPPERYRGKPKYDENTCVGCTACFQVCPARAIEVEDIVEGGSGKRVLTHYPDKCIFCGHCEANCITKEGIRLSNRYEISYFDPKEVIDTVEHELLICESCGSIIGTKRHILWIARKIGELAFSHPILISGLQGSLDIPSGYEEHPASPLQRQDVLKVICQKCRRIAFLADEQIKEMKGSSPG